MDRFVYHETPGEITYYGDHEYIRMKDNAANICIRASRANFLLYFLRAGEQWTLTDVIIGIRVKSALWCEKGARVGESTAAELLEIATKLIHGLDLPDNYRSDHVHAYLRNGHIKFKIDTPTIMTQELCVKIDHILKRPDLYAGAGKRVDIVKTLPQPIAEEILQEFRFFGPTRYAQFITHLRKLFVTITSSDPDTITTRPPLATPELTLEERRARLEILKQWRAENYTFWIKTKFGWRRLLWWNDCVLVRGESWGGSRAFIEHLRGW